MRKFTDFIIEKRNYILILFILLSIISVFVSKKVNINYDITKYLPNTSETRIGMDIMEKEFDETTSSLNLMFKDIDEDKKDTIYNELTKIDGVSSVNYEKNENYNKENYTLYIINVDDTEDSKTAKSVYKEIQEKYSEYDTYTSGAIAARNKPVLPAWILILAIGCALIILIIMSESYIEPFLFLFSILMAVVLNDGTNIIFDSVSNITSSISAILQLALSMDYSIMLINRYRQEKEKETDNIKAMKSALYNAFKSISSSSVTTIVGLIALVFMSFGIGKDLGFVLAKGVLFSLICIFCVLPALILMFDKLIEKTKKKGPHIKLDILGKIAYKFRYIAVPIFILVFVSSYFEKGNLNILYTEGEDDEISKVFTENNQIAVIYKNEDEEEIAKKLKSLEGKEKVEEVLGYGNTINEKLKYNELNDKINDLGAEIDVEDYLLQLLYYNYYNKTENNKMTFDQFVSFIKNEVYKNDAINEKLDNDTKKNIDRLENFTNSNLFNQQMNSTQIANILEIDKSKIDDILIYYNSKNNNLELTLNEFINFMNKEVLPNETYSKKIDSLARENLKKLEKFTNKSNIQKKITAEEMSNLFGIDKNTMNLLYTYYISTNEIDTRLSLYEFSSFVLNDVSKDSKYANLFDEKTINSIKTLNTFSNLSIITKNMNSKELSNISGIDENLIKQLLFLNYSKIDSGTKLSITDFINKAMYIKENTHYLDGIDISQIEKLQIFSQNSNNINTTKLDRTSLANIFDNIAKGLVDNVYLFLGLPDNYTMTPQEFVNLVISALSNSTNTESLDSPVFTIDSQNLNNLKILKLVIDDSIAVNKTQYTATELSNILDINKSQLYKLYALIDLTQNNTNNWIMTPQSFLKMILDNKNDENIKKYLNNEMINQLELALNIMNSSINNQVYSYNELAQFIGNDANTIKNIYALHTIKNNTLKITPQEFANFILEHKNDSILFSRITPNMTKELNLVKKVMEDTLKDTKYNSKKLSDLLGINIEDLNLLYGLYVSKNVTPNQTISLKDFVYFLQDDVMKNDEYSSNFDANSKTQVNTINGIINASINGTKYTKEEIFGILTKLTDALDKNTIDILYMYYGSINNYNSEWTLTIEQFVNYINSDILQDSRFNDFIEEDMRKNIIDAKNTVSDAKKMLVGENYSRIVFNTKLEGETKETFDFIQLLKDTFGDKAYVIGNSPMAYEMSKTFDGEMNFITILTMIAIFIVVAITFKSCTTPTILVLTIQCAVYMTMGILSISGGEGVYFIALLIVQSILMGATIDYAILYTSYYIEHRKIMSIKESVINSYNKSINTILTSSSILIIVTLIVGHFSSAITAKICKTISQGTLCSTILILILLPAVIAACDKLVVKNNLKEKTNKK